MEIRRHNIFDLIGGRQNIYHSAILTSYTFDPIFFESFYLPRLRQCGVSNVIVLLDASNYDQMLSRYPSFRIQSDRRLYTLIRQTPTNKGVFHPKLTMLFGEDAGILIVGSGNLTYNGYAINEEVWNTFSLKGADSVYLPLFKSAWKYLKALNLPESLLLRQQLKWMSDNVNWLTEGVLTKDVTIDHQEFIFMANDMDGTILSKLQDIVGNEQVKSITTIAPFYDTSGVTVKNLYDLFKPHEIECVYSEDGIYPYDLMKNKPDWLTLFSWTDVFSSKRSDIHKLHAKLVQLELPSRTILISGSANVTNAAFNGNGDEACVAIISDSSEDYVKDLGILLSQQSVASQAKLNELSKPERNQSDFINKRVQILSAEVIDGQLIVITDSRNADGLRLQVLDTKGDILQVYDAICSSGKLQIEAFALTDCMVVIVDSGNSEISNRCFIINDDDVARFNPNKALRKLESLLESNKDWRDNLAGILSFLWFEDKPDNKARSLTGTTLVVKKDTDGRLVSRDDFDNILIGGRQAVLSLPDIRIIDFILSSDKKKEEDLGESSDDTEGIADVDGGDNEYNNGERLINKHRQDSVFADSIAYYSKRLRKHYDGRLSELYSAAANFGADIFKKDFKNKASYISVADYSKILIDIVLIWKELTDDLAGKHWDARQDFICNLGKFLLLARKGYAQTNDFAWHKCVEFHRELIVYSLLIIASQDWAETVTIKLLLANLLDTCSGSNMPDIEGIVEIFLKKISESKVVPSPDSLALINETVNEYKIFSLHIPPDDTTMVRDVDFELSNGNYSYRKGYGFFYVTDINPVLQSDNNSLAYEMTLYHPGFDEEIKVIGGKKIRALSKGNPGS